MRNKILSVFFCVIFSSISFAQSSIFNRGGGQIDSNPEITKLRNERAQAEEKVLIIGKRLTQELQDNESLRKDIKGKEVSISNLEKILEDKSTAARNLQILGDQRHWSWISWCDSTYLNRISPLCRFSPEEVTWAKSLREQGLSADIAKDLWRFNVSVLLALLVFLATLYGFYSLLVWLLKLCWQKLSPPLRYFLDKNYRAELEKAHEKKCNSFNSQIIFLENELKNLNSRLHETEEKLERNDFEIGEKNKTLDKLKLEIQKISSNAQDILRNKIDMILREVCTQEEREKKIERLLYGRP